MPASPGERPVFSFAPRNHSTLTMSSLVACQLPLMFVVFNTVLSIRLPADRTSLMSWYAQDPKNQALSLAIGPPISNE